MQHPYRIAIALFVFFFGNVLVGKVSMAFFEYQLPLGLDGVTEFLVLCAACIFFVIGILRSENLAQNN
jgi:hypothetical protein